MHPQSSPRRRERTVELNTTPAPLDSGTQALQLLRRLGDHEAVRQIRPASLFNLDTALRALVADGVGGTLTIHIPAKTSGHVEIEYASAALH